MDNSYQNIRPPASTKAGSASRQVQPTEADYMAYIADLMDVEKYLEDTNSTILFQTLNRSTAAAAAVTDLSYALQVKQQQVSGVRKLAQTVTAPPELAKLCEKVHELCVQVRHSAKVLERMGVPDDGGSQQQLQQLQNQPAGDLVGPRNPAMIRNPTVSRPPTTTSSISFSTSNSKSAPPVRNSQVRMKASTSVASRESRKIDSWLDELRQREQYGNADNRGQYSLLEFNRRQQQQRQPTGSAASSSTPAINSGSSSAYASTPMMIRNPWTSSASFSPPPSIPMSNRPVSSPQMTASARDEIRTIDNWLGELRQRDQYGNADNRGQYTRWEFNRQSDAFIEEVGHKYLNAEPFELSRKLRVRFTSEDGIDRGRALTTEFFYVALETIASGTYKNSKLMIGERGHLLPNDCTDHLLEGYKFIGLMIAHAISNGCRGLIGLSPAIQHYLVHRRGNGNTAAFIEDMMGIPWNVDDVADSELRTVLERISKGGTANLSASDNGILRKWRDLSGCQTVLSVRTCHQVIQQILIYYIFTKRLQQIDAIAEGLDRYGLLEFLEENRSEENLSRVFPSIGETDITPQFFKAAVIMVRGRQTDSDTTWEFFERFLEDLYVQELAPVTISDLLRFISGSPYLPHDVTISFSDAQVLKPVANVHIHELKLPTGNPGYSEFRDSMRDGIYPKD